MPVHVHKAEVDEVIGAVTQVIEINCDSADAVNDLVYISESTPNFVDVSVGNLVPRFIIGMIIEKVSAPTVGSNHLVFFNINL